MLLDFFVWGNCGGGWILVLVFFSNASLVVIEYSNLFRMQV